MADSMQTYESQVLKSDTNKISRKQAKRTKAAFREVYGKDEIGIEVLTQHLYDLNFFDFVNTLEEAALHNQAIQLLRDMGIFDKNKGPENLKKVIRALLTVYLGDKE